MNVSSASRVTIGTIGIASHAFLIPAFLPKTLVTKVPGRCQRYFDPALGRQTGSQSHTGTIGTASEFAGSEGFENLRLLIAYRTTLSLKCGSDFCSGFWPGSPGHNTVYSSQGRCDCFAALVQKHPNMDQFFDHASLLDEDERRTRREEWEWSAGRRLLKTRTHQSGDGGNNT